MDSLFFYTSKILWMLLQPEAVLLYLLALALLLLIWQRDYQDLIFLFLQSLVHIGILKLDWDNQLQSNKLKTLLIL